MTTRNGPPRELALPGGVTLSLGEGTHQQVEQVARRAIRIDRQALALASASSVLCVDRAFPGSVVALGAFEPEPMEPIEAEPAVEKTAPAKVGLVRVEGPIAKRAVRGMCAYVDGYDAIVARFQTALAAEDVGSVLLVLDSPGGDVAGLEQAVERMRALKADSGKGVVAYVDETAASAAYWLAAAVADEIILPQAGRVGSIGCIGLFADETEAQRMEGVAWTVVRSPAGKADMMPLAPLTELATERLTRTVEAVTERFISAVASYRPGLTAKELKKLNGDVLEGPAAVEAGLADRLGSMDLAVERAAERAKPRAAAAQARVNDPHLFEAARARLRFAAAAKARRQL